MNRTARNFVSGVALGFSLLSGSLAAQDCDELQAMIAETYDFRPSELSTEQKNEAGKAMDGFWKHVQAHPVESLPCLRAALRDDAVDPWFAFDGSMLLVKIDPSRESKALQVELWCQTSFDDVDLQYWLESLARRGHEGFDVSVAGERWLTEDDASYLVARHGMFKVGPFEGAMFLFGSMDEAQATPALVRIAGNVDHPGRMIALQLLGMQATPDAWRALASIDIESLDVGVREAFRQLRDVAPTLPDGDDSVTFTRAQLLEDLRAAMGDEKAQRLEGNPDPADWIRNAVRELQQEDLDLIRQARRRRVTISSDEAVYEYLRYSLVLQARTWSARAPAEPTEKDSR